MALRDAVGTRSGPCDQHGSINSAHDPIGRASEEPSFHPRASAGAHDHEVDRVGAVLRDHFVGVALASGSLMGHSGPLGPTRRVVEGRFGLVCERFGQLGRDAPDAPADISVPTSITWRK